MSVRDGGVREDRAVRRAVVDARQFGEDVVTDQGGDTGAGGQGGEEGDLHGGRRIGIGAHSAKAFLIAALPARLARLFSRFL